MKKAAIYGLRVDDFQDLAAVTGSIPEGYSSRVDMTKNFGTGETVLRSPFGVFHYSSRDSDAVADGLIQLAARVRDNA